MNDAELDVRVNTRTAMAPNSISPNDVGRIAQVRQRQYQVEDVRTFDGSTSTLVRLSGIDPDNLGRPLEVIWEQELDAEAGDRETGACSVAVDSIRPTASRRTTTRSAGTA